MFKTKIIPLLGVFVGLLVAGSPVGAQIRIEPVIIVPDVVCTEGEQLVGFSARTTDGGRGVIKMNRLCNATFPGSHMCSTSEIGDSFVEVQQLAWVRPTIAAFGIDTDGNLVTGDVLGVSNPSFTGTPSPIQNTSCLAWSSSSESHLGFVIDGSVGDGHGLIGRRSCDYVLPVSCCALAKACTDTLIGTLTIEVLKKEK